MSGGGSGGGHTTSTVTQSNLPEYAKPYYKSLMRKGEKQIQKPYQAYEGPRIAGFGTDTTTGLGMATDYAGSDTPGFEQANQWAQGAGLAALDAANYNPNAIHSNYGGPTGYQAGTFGADQVGPMGMWTEANRDAYMSPYMDDVTAAAQRDAAHSYRIEEAMRSADAARTGQFGGSRHALMNQVARGDMQDRLSDIFVEGRQRAYENAQQQFERDRGIDLASQRANQNANLEALGMGEQSRQFGYGTDEESRRIAGQMDLSAQEATENFRQQAARMGIDAGQLMNQSSSQLASIQQAQDAAMQQRIKAQLGVGQAEDDLRQQQLDLAYEDFINQRDYKRQNLQFMSSLLQGVPISANQNVTTTMQQNTNPLQGALGAATGLQALYKLGE
jgi:hypothetical protein